MAKNSCQKVPKSDFQSKNDTLIWIPLQGVYSQDTIIGVWSVNDGLYGNLLETS